MEETIHAYTAGLLDGEGSITLSRQHRNEFRSPVVSICNTDTNLIQFLEHHYGGTVVKKKKYKPHHLQSYTWSITYKYAIDFLKLIFPYILHEEKRRRACLIIDKYDSVTVRNGRYNPKQFKDKMDFELEFFSHPTYTL